MRGRPIQEHRSTWECLVVVHRLLLTDPLGSPFWVVSQVSLKNHLLFVKKTLGLLRVIKTITFFVGSEIKGFLNSSNF